MSKKVIIGFVIFATVLIGLSVFNYSRIDSRIIKCIENLGFKLNDDLVYTKNISSLSENSENINLYFNPINYELYQERFSVIDGVYFYFEPSYNYHSGILMYSYEIVDGDTTVFYTGNYDMDTQDLVCNDGESSCDNYIYEVVNYYVLNFVYEINNIITNPEFLKYMQKKDIEEQIQVFD